MNSYSDASRGKVQYEEHFKQLVLFDGMKYFGSNGYQNVTPTDIDGFIQLDKENAYIFFELKYEGDLPSGQKRAYVNLVKTINKGGGRAVLFVAEHNSHEQMINASTAICTKMYNGNGWVASKERTTLGVQILRYIEWLHKGD